MIKPPLRAVHINLLVLVQEKVQGGLYQYVYVRMVNHCPVCVCVLVYLAVYIVYIRDKRPNLQHLAFLDVERKLPVYDKNNQ